MALARPPAGKEAAAGAGKTRGMYHWAKGRPKPGERAGPESSGFYYPEVTWSNGRHRLNGGLALRVGPSPYEAQRPNHIELSARGPGERLTCALARPYQSELRVEGEALGQITLV